jgi:hypothetical protein
VFPKEALLQSKSHQGLPQFQHFKPPNKHVKHHKHVPGLFPLALAQTKRFESTLLSSSGENTNPSNN